MITNRKQFKNYIWNCIQIKDGIKITSKPLNPCLYSKLPTLTQLKRIFLENLLSVSRLTIISNRFINYSMFSVNNNRNHQLNNSNREYCLGIIEEFFLQILKGNLQRLVGDKILDIIDSNIVMDNSLRFSIPCYLIHIGVSLNTIRYLLKIIEKGNIELKDGNETNTDIEPKNKIQLKDYVNKMINFCIQYHEYMNAGVLEVDTMNIWDLNYLNLPLKYLDETTYHPIIYKRVSKQERDYLIIISKGLLPRNEILPETTSLSDYIQRLFQLLITYRQISISKKQIFDCLQKFRIELIHCLLKSGFKVKIQDTDISRKIII